ncbi:MAG: hypothetical protein C5B51_19765 [Terriglobia bacterium]|nr:MAG: hypothetical protein C5B51_19765 [Terriglobia bacterium]
MFPILFPFFHWADASWLSLEIRSSTWQFAILEMIHLVGLTILLGTLWVLDMRLLGLGMRRQPAAELARDLSRWMWIGLWIMLVSGVLLFFGEPMKLFGNPSFHVKMMLLVLAIGFQLTLFRRVVSDKSASAFLDQAAAGLSLVLWFGVGLAGRGIGFL